MAVAETEMTSEVGMTDPRTALEDLIQQWRRGASNGFRHCLEQETFKLCADELEAALRDTAVPGKDDDVCTPDMRDAQNEQMARDGQLYSDAYFKGRRDAIADAQKAAVASLPSGGLTFENFAAVNRERCESPNGFNHKLSSWSTSDWFTAIIGELGEAANVAKKLNRIRDGIPGNKESEPELREKLRRELGDAFVYLDLLAQSLGFTIGAAAVDVFNAKSDEIGCQIKLARWRSGATPAYISVGLDPEKPHVFSDTREKSNELDRTKGRSGATPQEPERRIKVSEKLKPCPFCGGKASIIEVTEPSNEGGYVVQCGDCEASTRVWFPIKDRVDGILRDAWNRRLKVEGSGATPSGWQAIDTAPTDGSFILGANARGYGNGANLPSVTKYNGYEWLRVPGNYAWAPTHWMPLPSPPTGGTT